MTGVRAGTYPFVQRFGEYGGHIYHDLIAHESEPFLDRAICKCVLKAQSQNCISHASLAPDVSPMLGVLQFKLRKD